MKVNNIKSITLYQPWASLIKDLLKPEETRSWETKYRGILAIHAGMHVDKDACKQFGYDPIHIPRGVVLCTVNLIKCVQFPSPLTPPNPYGDFTPGRFGWILKDVKPIEPPIPAVGGRRLWNWEPAGHAQARRLY